MPHRFSAHFQGVKYMFVSNSDNLGATLDLKILSYFSRLNVPMLMEVWSLSFLCSFQSCV